MKPKLIVLRQQFAPKEDTGSSSHTSTRASKVVPYFFLPVLLSHIWPVSRQQILASILRGNIYSEVTNPFCWLPSSTLIYRLEAVHIVDQLRMLVWHSAKYPYEPLRDPDWWGRLGYRDNCDFLYVQTHISLLMDPMGFEGLCRKKLFLDFPTISGWNFEIFIQVKIKTYWTREKSMWKLRACTLKAKWELIQVLKISASKGD